MARLPSSSRGALAAVALALVLGLAAAPGAGAAGLRIERPVDDGFFAKPAVRVELRAPKGTRSVRVTVEGRSVGKALRKVRPGLWRSQLGARQLRRGVNHMVAVSRGGSGARGYASSRFVVGTIRPGLLTLGPAKLGASGLAAPLRIGSSPQRLSASLNGRRLRWPTGLWPSRSAVLRLGADDGLRFGSNRLRVFAARGDGAFDVERNTVVVPRTRPLVGAGGDRYGVAGTGFRLDGRSTRAALPGASLAYRWQLVRAPRGSKRKLTKAATPRPRLHADRPGTYAVRLTVTEPVPGGKLRRAADTTTVRAVADVPPIGMPIETMVPSGQGPAADMAIRIGGTRYPLGAPKGNRVQAVILDRTTLEPVYSAAYAGSKADAETLAAKIASAGNRPLVVISAPAFSGGSINAAFVPIVQSIGVPTGQLSGGRTGWSVVGVAGSKGGAYLGAGANLDSSSGANLRGALDGYLQKTIPASGKEVGPFGFAYVPASRVSFDSSAPGAPELRNKILVGDAEYLSSPLESCGTGGFQIQVLLAETLAPVIGGTVTTNGCGTAADSLAQIQLAAFVDGITAGGTGTEEGPKLVLVQSIGSPYDATASGWNPLSLAMERIGGTASVFAAARAGYTLVGGVGLERLPLTEASQTLTGALARIGGLLVPDRRGAYVPMLSSPTGETPYDLTEIAYQPSQPWPYSQTAGERKALAYVATKVLDLPEPSAGSCYVPPQPDVRSEYCNLAVASSWAGYVSQVRDVKFPSGQGFSEEDWEHVTTALAGPGYNEFNTVAKVWGLVSALQKAFGYGETAGRVDLRTIATEVEQAIAPPANSEALGWWLELLANFAAIASYFDLGIPDEVAQKITGTLSGGLFISGQLIYDREGNPLAEEFKLDADDLAKALSERYTAASGGLAKLGSLIVSDAGKLRATAQSPALGINSEGVEELAALLGMGGRQWTYEAMLPVAYEAVVLLPGELLNNPLPANANQYECEFFEAGGGSGGYFPFKAPTAAQLRNDAPGPALGVMVLRGSELPSDGDPEQHPRSPTKSLLEPLFKKPEKEGLGLFAPWFWRSAFDYPGGKTKEVFCR